MSPVLTIVIAGAAAALLLSLSIGSGSQPPCTAPGPLAPQTVETMAGAVAAQEGYGIPGDRPTRNNNPGDLRWWTSSLPVDPGGFTIFPAAADGWAALYEDIQNHAAANLGESIQGWIDTYAPASDSNDPIAYAAAVAAAVGVTPQTTFAELAGGMSA